MKESKHDIDFFLTNPNFISWVKHPNGNLDVFWKKWLENHPESKKSFYTAKAALQRVNYRTANVSKNRREEILGNILKNSVSPLYRKERNFKERTINILPWAMGSAAAILLFMVLTTFFRDVFYESGPSSPIQIITKFVPEGERALYYLPDSTLVTMNSGSSIKYPSLFNDNIREVTLVGEAYFDVKHDADKEFWVRSGDIVIKVHGTSFNVKAYRGGMQVKVSLERGSVSVHSQLDMLKGMSYHILPGEKLTVSKDFEHATKSVFDYESEFGWKDGILVFDDSDLDDFIALMERWYGININVLGQGDGNWAINGRFKGESLENVLKSLEFSREVAYKIQGKQVTLYLNNN